MNDSSGGAVEEGRRFAQDNNYTNVTSTLIYGVQWDATMQFMDNNYITGTCDENSYVRNSTGKGNYTGSRINTGSNENYKMKNIYDMAGNIIEWTMEAKDIDSRVYRGGSYVNNPADTPASLREGFEPYKTFEPHGFRIALYL